MIKNRFHFRAWHKEDKRMMYNLNLFGCGAITDCEFEVEEIIDDSPNGYDFIMHEKDEVILMQSTGLVDRYDKEIFEGDIIKLDNTIRFVNYNDKKGRLVASYITDINDYCDFDEDWILKYEVIGNIYQNKELLKE